MRLRGGPIYRVGARARCLADQGLCHCRVDKNPGLTGENPFQWGRNQAVSGGEQSVQNVSSSGDSWWDCVTDQCSLLTHGVENPGSQWNVWDELTVAVELDLNGLDWRHS